jgi:hypothetical protein
MRTPVARSVTRKKFLLASGGAATAAAAGGAGIGLLGGSAAARTPPSPAQDRRILAFLLTLQRIERGFYAEARRAGTLRGELAEFAAAAAVDERRHAAALAGTLGQPDSAAPVRFAAADAFRSPAAFAAKAVVLEDAVVAACNGQVTNLTPERLAQVCSIVSVEARHAAWIRDLAGAAPAGAATDAPLDADAVRDRLRREGLWT